MRRSFKVATGALALFAAAVTTVPTPAGAAIDPPTAISNGTVEIGVNPEGDLNAAGVGIRYLPSGNDGIIPGCECEGWGAGDETSGVSGWAGRSFGVSGVEVVDFATTGSSAVSVAQIPDATDPIIEVTHDYHPSASPNLFEVTVTLENVSDAPQIPRYRRAMDWDIPPTTFDEAVTIQGTGTSSSVIFASDDGFASGDPFAGESWINFTGDAVKNVDEVLTPGGDGPDSDHGALFDFRFDPLAPGESFTFNIYYGAAGNETEAAVSLAAVQAEVYSFGQPSDEAGLSTGEPNTFIFAFQGVGGETIQPLTLTPETATNPVGTSHTVTANFTLNEEPVADQEISFEVLTGPHAGETGVATTDADGNASFSYTGVAAGTDQIQATTTYLDQPLESNVVTKSWVNPTTTTTAAPTTTTVRALTPATVQPRFTG